VRERLRGVVAEPERDPFLENLERELEAKEAEDPAPIPALDQPVPPESESSEDVLARVIADADAAEPEDAKQREHEALVQEYVRELKARPKTIPLRDRLDMERRLDPPARRQDPPRDPAGYLALRPFKRDHPSNR
jgi:hypothetical protein